jgi:hypothetical protein
VASGRAVPFLGREGRLKKAVSPMFECRFWLITRNSGTISSNSDVAMIELVEILVLGLADNLIMLGDILIEISDIFGAGGAL